jgi:hypothetical protein
VEGSAVQQTTLGNVFDVALCNKSVANSLNSPAGENQ